MGNNLGGNFKLPPKLTCLTLILKRTQKRNPCPKNRDFSSNPFPFLT